MELPQYCIIYTSTFNVIITNKDYSVIQQHRQFCRKYTHTYQQHVKRSKKKLVVRKSYGDKLTQLGVFGTFTATHSTKKETNTKESDCGSGKQAGRNKRKKRQKKLMLVNYVCGVTKWDYSVR